MEIVVHTRGSRRSQQQNSESDPIRRTFLQETSFLALSEVEVDRLRGM